MSILDTSTFRFNDTHHLQWHCHGILWNLWRAYTPRSKNARDSFWGHLCSVVSWQGYGIHVCWMSPYMPLWSRKVGKLQYLILFGHVDRCLNGPWRIKIHCSHIMAIIYLIIYDTFPHFFPPQRCLLSKDIDKDKSQIHDLIGGEGSFRLLQKYPTGIHPSRNKGLIKP